MFLKITQADGTYLLVPTNYVTSVRVDANNRITGVEYLDGINGAVPVTVVVINITQTSAIKYEIGQLREGPVFHTHLSNRNPA